MKSPDHTMPQNITFKNEPKVVTHESDKESNERRLALVPKVKAFLETDAFFKGKEIQVEFSHAGVSSLVSFIEAGDEKFVLKFPLANRPKEGEAEFLKVWESAGVAVPHVIEDGKFQDRPYVLMDFVNAALLSDAMKKMDKEQRHALSIQNGRTLQMMHMPKAQGFGEIYEGKPINNDFKEWIVSDDIKKKILLTQENNILSEEHGSLSKVLDILVEYAEQNPDSRYCHFDYGSDNMLATDPPTIIDPNPMLNLGIMDMARSMLLQSSQDGNPNSGETFAEGYFSEGNEVAPKVLQAAIILNGYMKLPYWHKKARTEKIDNVKKYLEATRSKLEK